MTEDSWSAKVGSMRLECLPKAKKIIFCFFVVLMTGCSARSNRGNPFSIAGQVNPSLSEKSIELSYQQGQANHYLLISGSQLNQDLVLGGFDGKEWTTTSELYDFDSDTWSSTSVSPMPHPVRFCAATTVVEEGKFVFVCGEANNGDDCEASSTLVQCYNVNEDRWAVLGHSKGMLGSALASIGQNLVAFGGYSTSTVNAMGNAATGDDHASVLSQETRSWKLTDVNFGKLWIGDGKVASLP